MKNETGKKESVNNIEKENLLKRGEEAIKIHHEIVDKGKPKEQQNKEEEKDAEKWHSEG